MTSSLFVRNLGRASAHDDTHAAREQVRIYAFAVMDAAYLLKTWHSSTRPAHVDFDPKLRWTGLDIVGTTGGTAFHTDGTVEEAPGKATLSLGPGDVVVVETPGGGGWGQA